MANVASNLSRQIVHRGEDASCEQLAFNAAEPQLDLVQPRRVGRREVEMHVRMRLEEGGHRSRLVRRQVVENHVNLTPARLTGHDVAEKCDERFARVARHGLAEHVAGLRVQRGEQRQRAVAEVLEAVALGAPSGQWQHRVQAIERLNRVFSSAANTAACCGGCK